MTAQQQSRFFKGCGPAELDTSRMTYYRCTRALEDLAGPAAQVLDARGHTDTERADALAIYRGVLSPTGLARLALS